MKCEEILQLLEDYHVGTLDVKQNEMVHQHINECPDCHQKSEQLHRLERFLQLQKADIPAIEQAVERIKVRFSRILETKKAGVEVTLRRLAICAAAVALILISVISFQNILPQATLEGNVAIKENGSWSKADSVSFGKKARLEKGIAVFKSPDANIVLEEGTIFSLTDQKTLNLDRGRVTCTIEPGKKGFSVKTPLGDIYVKGTQFVVEVLERRQEMKTDTLVMSSLALSVIVISGLVVYKTGSEEYQLNPGDSLTAGSGKSPSKLTKSKLESRLKQLEKESQEIQITNEKLAMENKKLSKASTGETKGSASDERRKAMYKKMVTLAQDLHKKYGRFWGDLDQQDIQKIFNIMTEFPEIALWVTDPAKVADFYRDFLITHLEDAGTPLTKEQHASLHSLTEEFKEALCRKSEYKLEQTINFSRAMLQSRKGLEELLTYEQKNNIQVTEALFRSIPAFSESARLSTYVSGASDKKTLASAVANGLKESMNLSEQQRVAIQPLVINFIDRYQQTRWQMDMEHGKEFTDAYFNLTEQRPDDFLIKKAAADVKLLELQLELQKQLLPYLDNEQKKKLKEFKWQYKFPNLK